MERINNFAYDVDTQEINAYEVEYMNSEENQDYIKEYGLQDWEMELVRE